jgi:glycosyltransferase involved in cell wall biosynthesis
MLKSQTVNLGIDQIVHFVGYSSNPFQYVSSYDLFVLPSLSEGLPVSLVEAIYLNVPVLATDVQGNREIVREGENGIMVPTRDSQSLAEGIIEFYKNKEKYLTKARNAKDWLVSNFSRGDSFDRIFKLYKELI